MPLLFDSVMPVNAVNFNAMAELDQPPLVMVMFTAVFEDIPTAYPEAPPSLPFAPPPPLAQGLLTVDTEVSGTATE